VRLFQICPSAKRQVQNVTTKANRGNRAYERSVQTAVVDGRKGEGARRKTRNGKGMASSGQVASNECSSGVCGGFSSILPETNANERCQRHSHCQSQ